MHVAIVSFFLLLECTRASLSDAGVVAFLAPFPFFCRLFCSFFFSFSFSSFFFFLLLLLLLFLFSFFFFFGRLLACLLARSLVCLLASILTPFSGKTLLLPSFKALLGGGSVLALLRKKRAVKEKRPEMDTPGCPFRALFFERHRGAVDKGEGS